jgi:hypothetical protein
MTLEFVKACHVGHLSFALEIFLLAALEKHPLSRGLLATSWL